MDDVVGGGIAVCGCLVPHLILVRLNHRKSPVRDLSMTVSLQVCIHHTANEIDAGLVGWHLFREKVGDLCQAVPFLEHAVYIVSATQQAQSYARSAAVDVLLKGGNKTEEPSSTRKPLQARSVE